MHGPAKGLYYFMEETMPVEADAKGGRVYELSFLLVPTIEEDKIAGIFGDIKHILEEKGASFVSEEMPRMIDLAYEMSRTIENKKTWFETAYFSWIKFEVDAEMIKEIHEVLARDERVIRFMMLKTVRENTIASKKPFNRDARRRDDVREESGEKVEKEPVAPLSEEQIDSEIDALAIE